MVVIALRVTAHKIRRGRSVVSRARKIYSLYPDEATKSDSEVERDVREELKWDHDLDHDLDAEDIAISVKNGVITLAGFTHSYDAVVALKSELPISHDRIKVIVKDGWITLEGAVEWQYQKTSAEHAVRNVKGVRGITNVITAKPKVQPHPCR